MHTNFATLREARSHMTDLTDAALSGRPVSYARDGRQVAVVDAERLRGALSKLHPARAVAFHEGGGFAEAVREMVIALREYAADWDDHLLNAPNHANNWGLVQIIALSTDEQLATWVRGT